MSIDEFLHLILQHAHGQEGNAVFVAFGHISTYDPASHSAKVVLPAHRDANGVPVLSPWVPVGSLWVGHGFGIQVVPHGGATQANPTAGEQCILLLCESKVGTSVVACLCYTDVMRPPGNLNPGEILVLHESGSYLKFDKSGKIELSGASGQDVNIKVSGGGAARINGGSKQVARVGDTDNHGDVIVSGSAVLLTD